MSQKFREHLKSVGSGSHTSKPLTREAAAEATVLMLTQEATPAQIGAFMIAHRIKRPVPEELAGMLDAYEFLGPTLPTLAQDPPVMVLSYPYDGRSRTAPVTPITALLLAAAGIPTLLHGGTRMPTKEGLPLIDIWQALDLPLHRLTLVQVQALMEQTGLGFLYLPTHFPTADALVPYRDQIGKRPPFATIELMWTPYRGTCQTITGFVHPPTENLARETFQLRGLKNFTTVKGLEGSCDLPRARTDIIGLAQNGEFERLLLHPRDYGFEGEDVPLQSETTYLEDLQATIAGRPSELTRSAIWSGGFYLWRSGVYPTLEAGLEAAEIRLHDGAVQAKLNQIQQTVNQMALALTP